MGALDDAIASEIRAHGPITVARFMELALYHPHLGYYSSGAERTGWRGDFVTSPEVDPAYGTLWCEAMRRLWADLGAPERFDLVEVGPGEGSFAAAVLDAVEGAFGDAVRMTLVEPIPALQRRQRDRLRDDRVGWVEALDDAERFEAGCVFCNEVLDNSPVHLVEGTGDGIVEAFVDVTGHGFALVWNRPGAEVLDALPAPPPPGVRAEVSPAALDLVARAARCVGRGAAVFVDYGDERAALTERAGGTLMCYGPGGADDDFLRAPGTKDITAHVDWTAVRATLTACGMEVHGPVPQHDVLRSLGLSALDAELRARAAAGSGAEAVRALSRRSALGVLSDPGGLGGLGVMTGTRAAHLPLEPPDGGRP